jgi:hypothetical protein
MHGTGSPQEHFALRRLRLRAAALLAVGPLLACTPEQVPMTPVGPPPQSPTVQAGDHVHYVSAQAGRDRWPGTRAKPWRTLGEALPALKPGDLLYVRGGSYRERVVKLKIRLGAPGARIVVQAFPGERPVVRGLVWLRRPSYWTFDGINVTWDPAENRPYQQMVKVNGGVGWTWRNSEVWGARSYADFVVTGSTPGEPADWSLRGNCFHNSRARSEGRWHTSLSVGDVTPGSGPGLVARNLFWSESAGRNITLGQGPVRIVLRYNTLYGAAVPVVLAGKGRGLTIDRNIIGSDQVPVLVRSPDLAGPGHVIRHNLGFGAKAFVSSAEGDLRIGAGNLLVERPFKRLHGCSGFRDGTEVTLPYGRYGISAPGT